MAPTSVATLGERFAERVPLGGNFMNVLVSFAAITCLSVFLFQRAKLVKAWSQLPFVSWLVFAIYIDSYTFVVSSAIMQQVFGVNSEESICHGAILLCLICYMTTKFIYFFLVEKAHIIRSTTKRRLQSKLYLFNSFGMLGVYLVVVVLNFIFRIAKIENGICIIGMKSISMIPLISFDALVNIYLTFLFLIPLKNLYSFKNMPKSPANIRLRSVAFRTFVGAVCTLISSIVNLSVLMSLRGEPGWVCLMCCNSDILFSAIVIQWVTHRDNTDPTSQVTGSASAANNSRAHRGNFAATHEMSSRQPHALGSPHGTDAEISLVATATAASSDDGGSNDADMAQVSSKGAKGGVVITTTIRRQSNPSNNGSFGLDMSPRGIPHNYGNDEEAPVYGYPPRRSSYGVNDAPEPPRTRITGGTAPHGAP